MMNDFDVVKESLENIIDSYSIDVPDFQRKLVWNVRKKADLIDSLVNTFPIGAFTLYSNDKEHEFFLIDGLQRYNTIREYLNNPSSIVSFKEYFSRIEKAIEDFSTEFDINFKKLKKSIMKWYKGLDFDENNRYGFESFNFLKSNFCNVDNKIIEDFSIFQNLRDILIKNIDVRKQNIACIIYKGDKDNLPEIFAKINQKNISLTPYEILHSLWYKYKMPEEYSGINYKKIFEEYISSNSSFVNKEITTFNVFMYITALGYIFTKKAKSINITNVVNNILNEELIFDTFSLVCKKTTNKINTSIDEMCRGNSCDSYATDIFNIGQAIMNTFDELNNFITNVDIDNESIQIDSKYQYLYLFYLFFANRYNIKDNKVFKNNQNLIDINNLTKFMKKIDAMNWFKDEYRQLNFFNQRIKDIEENINNSTSILDLDILIDEFNKQNKKINEFLI